MRAKKLVELLTLTTNLYMISKDEEFLHHLSEMAHKGKQKFDDILEDFSGEGEEGEEKLLQKILQKAKQAKADLERKIEETAVKVYDKMHIAHTDELRKMEVQVETLKRELALAEARIVLLEQKKS